MKAHQSLPASVYFIHVNKDGQCLCSCHKPNCNTDSRTCKPATCRNSDTMTITSDLRINQQLKKNMTELFAYRSKKVNLWSCSFPRCMLILRRKQGPLRVQLRCSLPPTARNTVLCRFRCLCPPNTDLC